MLMDIKWHHPVLPGFSSMRSPYYSHVVSNFRRGMTLHDLLILFFVIIKLNECLFLGSKPNLAFQNNPMFGSSGRRGCQPPPHFFPSHALQNCTRIR